jgi:hypothetical protein
LALWGTYLPPILKGGSMPALAPPI